MSPTKISPLMYGQTAPQTALKHVPAPRSSLLAVQRYRASRSKQVIRTHMRPLVSPLTVRPLPYRFPRDQFCCALRAPLQLARSIFLTGLGREKIIIKYYFLRLHFNVDFIFGKSKILEKILYAEIFRKILRCGHP